MKTRSSSKLLRGVAAYVAVFAGLAWGPLGERSDTATAHSVFVRAASLEEAAQAVRSVGGEVAHELGTIAVAASLTDAQQEQIALREPSIVIYANAPHLGKSRLRHLSGERQVSHVAGNGTEWGEKEQ